MSCNQSGGCWRRVNKFLLVSSGSVIVDDRARRQNRKTTPVLPSPLFRGRRRGLHALRAPGAPRWGGGRGWRVLQPGAWGATRRECGERHLGTQPALCGEPSKAPRPCPRLRQRLRGSPGGSGKSALLPFRSPQEGGALSVGPAQRLSRFRGARKVRLGGAAAPGHAGASGCPECPASHPPPPPAFLQLHRGGRGSEESD